MYNNNEVISYLQANTKEISTVATQVFIIVVRTGDPHDYFCAASGVFFS
ncbi:hypothetical protein [Klebsiella pasteurii]